MRYLSNPDECSLAAFYYYMLALLLFTWQFYVALFAVISWYFWGMIIAIPYIYNVHALEPIASRAKEEK